MAIKQSIPLNVPYNALSEKEKEKILYGVSGTFELNYITRFDEGKTHKAKYEGLIPNLERRYKESDMGNDAFMKRIAQFATERICRNCSGHRLKKEYLSVLV